MAGPAYVHAHAGQLLPSQRRALDDIVPVSHRRSWAARSIGATTVARWSIAITPVAIATVRNVRRIARSAGSSASSSGSCRAITISSPSPCPISSAPSRAPISGSSMPRSCVKPRPPCRPSPTIAPGSAARLFAILSCQRLGISNRLIRDVLAALAGCFSPLRRPQWLRQRQVRDDLAGGLTFNVRCSSRTIFGSSLRARIYWTRLRLNLGVIWPQRSPDWRP